MTLRLAPLLILALLPACAKENIIMDGGVYTRRSACPVAGVPAGTGDITLFTQPGRTDASALDVSAAITNVRSTCQEAGNDIISTLTFDVVATRRDAGAARQVVLPYFDVVLQGGTSVAAKRVGYVAVNFPAGAQRAQVAGQATARVNRGAAALSEEVQQRLTRKRKPGDADAAVDPMTDPAVREAVARATFEHLVGFQLTEAQLRYNVTR